MLSGRGGYGAMLTSAADLELPAASPSPSAADPELQTANAADPELRVPVEAGNSGSAALGTDNSISATLNGETPDPNMR